MSRREFLEKLREALCNELNASAVQENIDYYNNYISKEVGKGYTEEGVIQELGDPWIIARTIIDGQGSGSTYTSYATDASENRSSYENSDENNVRFKVFGIDSWWKKLLGIVLVLLIFVSVIAIVTGIIGLIAPILIPVLIIVFVIRIFGNR